MATAVVVVLICSHQPLVNFVPGAKSLNQALLFSWAFFVSEPLGAFAVSYQVDDGPIYKIPALEKGFFKSFSITQIHNYKKQYEVYIAQKSLDVSRSSISTHVYFNSYLCRRHLGAKKIKYLEAEFEGSSQGLGDYQGAEYACRY